MELKFKVFKQAIEEEPFSLLTEKEEELLDKLINIKKVSQFEQLDLDEEKCEELIQTLKDLPLEISNLKNIQLKAKNIRSEFIPISLSEDNFI